MTFKRTSLPQNLLLLQGYPCPRFQHFLASFGLAVMNMNSTFKSFFWQTGAKGDRGPKGEPGEAFGGGGSGVSEPGIVLICTVSITGPELCKTFT